MREGLLRKLSPYLAGSALVIASVMLPELEGIKYVASPDVAGTLDVCYGHTGKDIIKGKRYTDKECRALLDADLKAVAAGVDPYIRSDISNTQRAAIYTFAYNVGITAFRNSMMLKKINAGDQKGACDELRRWTYAGGKQWKGLMNRRAIEHELCTWSMK